MEEQQNGIIAKISHLVTPHRRFKAPYHIEMYWRASDFLYTQIYIQQIISLSYDKNIYTVLTNILLLAIQDESL